MNGLSVGPIVRCRNREWVILPSPDENLFCFAYQKQILIMDMPAIAPIEDLRATQEEGLSIYALLHALCSLRYAFGGDGAALVGKTSANSALKKEPRNN